MQEVNDEDDRSTILIEQFDEQFNRLEYQQEKIGEQIEKCFTDYFQNDPTIGPEKVKSYCSGLFNNVMNMTFRKGMRLMVMTYKDLLKIELEPFKDLFENEIVFFFELFDMFIEKDFEIVQSFKDLEESVFMHVQANEFKNLLQIVDESLQKFEHSYEKQRNIRNRVKTKIEQMVKERESYLRDMLLSGEIKKKI